MVQNTNRSERDQQQREKSIEKKDLKINSFIKEDIQSEIPNDRHKNDKKKNYK